MSNNDENKDSLRAKNKCRSCVNGTLSDFHIVQNEGSIFINTTLFCSKYARFISEGINQQGFTSIPPEIDKIEELIGFVMQCTSYERRK